jgi:hypothetical protein
VRYDYETYVKEPPCKESSGSPEVEVAGCKGEFVGHF